ncbi:hypothetical protein HDU90_002150 [Geranomyces variabilis]|nr:hypothetical protein HDU90_002150 [Geranomyces variabilis]
MESTAQYPTPQTLIALIEQSQQMLNQVRQQPPLTSTTPQDTAERFGKVHDNVRALRRHVVDSRNRVLDDPVFALQQEIEQLRNHTAQKHTAINTYTHFFTTWQQTLHNISSTTNAALSRSFRDDTLLPPDPYVAATLANGGGDDFATLYAPLDDVNDNPYVVGGGDAAALLLPLASPLDGTAQAGGGKMMLPVTTTTRTAPATTTTTTATATAGGFADAVLDSGFGADVGGFGASADDFLGSSMDTFSGAGMMAGGSGVGGVGIGVGVGIQNPQLQLQMSSSLQPPQGLYELFGGGGGGGGGAGVDDGGGGGGGGGGGSDSQFSTSSMMMDDSGTSGLKYPFAGIGGDGSSMMGAGSSSLLSATGVTMPGVSSDAAASMDGLFADALNGGGLLAGQWGGGNDDASSVGGNNSSTLLPTSGGVPPLTSAFAGGLGSGAPLASTTTTPATTQPLDPNAAATAAAAAATDAAAVDLGDGFFDEFMVDDES